MDRIVDGGRGRHAGKPKLACQEGLFTVDGGLNCIFHIFHSLYILSRCHPFRARDCLIPIIILAVVTVIRKAFDGAIGN
jgi:hypothetical protein